MSKDFLVLLLFFFDYKRKFESPIFKFGGIYLIFLLYLYLFIIVYVLYIRALAVFYFAVIQYFKIFNIIFFIKNLFLSLPFILLRYKNCDYLKSKCIY